MTAPANPIVVIPARMASTRLPGKPLADIHGTPMIVHVWRRAVKAQIGPVVVACAEAEVAEAVEASGGRAVLTTPDLPSGSDRIFEALSSIDPNGRHDAVVNVQGDLPTIDVNLIQAVFEPLSNPAVDIATLAAKITRTAEKDNPNVVKVVMGLAPGQRTGRALYFSRAAAPAGKGSFYRHIGLYAYRREALARFVAFSPGVLEQRERLEQLRALENGMHINVALVSTALSGVDTPADLDRARDILAP